MSRVEPNRNVYVGHRYVPLLVGEWDKSIQYEGLSIVTFQGASYTSKKRVPVGIDILNEDFWVVTGNYNAQVEYYREETERVAKDLLLKSDKTYVDTELGKKSDKTYVDTELGKKADTSFVNTELGKKSDKTYVDTELDKKSDITYVNTELDKKSDLVTEDINYSIPTDFSTLNEAIKYITRSHYQSETQIIITIERGHRPDLSVNLKNIFIPYITLNSVDDVVYLNKPINKTLFEFENSYGFVLDCLIDVEGSGLHGIYLYGGSHMVINRDAGVINTGSNGLYCRGGSQALAEGSIFTGSGQTDSQGAGITAWGGIVNARFADVSNGLAYGARAAHGGSLDFDDGIANNVGRHAIRASQSGVLTCRNSSATNAGVHGIYALNSSLINARESDVTGAGNTGYFANASSSINAYSGVANNCDIGVNATENSRINFRGGKSNDCINAKLRAEDSSTIEARNLEALGNSLYGVYVTGGSEVGIRNGNIRNSRDSNLRVLQGSKVNARSATIRNTPSENASAHNVVVQEGSHVNLQDAVVAFSGGMDLYTNYGGTISAHGCTTTTNASENISSPHIDDISSSALNTLSSRGYILG